MLIRVASDRPSQQHHRQQHIQDERQATVSSWEQSLDRAKCLLVGALHRNQAVLRQDQQVSPVLSYPLLPIS
nr:hypothetical protein CFP56_56490 [Quercus suber]